MGDPETIASCCISRLTGENWGSGLIVSSDEEGPDGYSANCRIHTYDDDVPDELMVLYSIIYKGRDTNEYVFFIKPN